jgi:hypothetical protein
VQRNNGLQSLKVLGTDVEKVRHSDVLIDLVGHRALVPVLEDVRQTGDGLTHLFSCVV